MEDWTPAVDGTERVGYDMAWGVMDRALGELTGYFGMMARSVRSIQEKGYTIRNAAYSSCTKGNDPIPPNCLYRHVFLDSEQCHILSEAELDTEGWGRAVAHGCDTNPGHSGSPLVVTKNGSLYVWAVHSSAIGGVNYAARVTYNRLDRLIPKMYKRFPRD